VLRNFDEIFFKKKCTKSIANSKKVLNFATAKQKMMAP